MKQLLVLSACLCLASVLPASAQPLDNWHQWRGPLATGVSPTGDPPLKWDQNTNIRWKTAIPGKGSATPIIWGDRVFVLTAIDTERTADAKDLPKPDPRFAQDKKTKAPNTYHQFVVLCLDRTTGKVLWQRTAIEEVPHEGTHPTHSYAAGSPTTDGKFLYASFGSRGIYCYDFDGKLHWKRDFGELHTRYGWGEGASPTLHGDTLFINWDGEGDSYLYALNTRNGDIKWQAKRDEETTWTTPLVVEHKGRMQVILNGAKRVRSYDVQNGQPLWECGGQTLLPIPSAVAHNGVVYIVSGYKGAFGCAISLDATGDVSDTNQVLWRIKRGTPYVPSPLLVDDRLYFTQANTPMLTCLDAKTGKPIFEEQRLPNLGSLYASPTAAKDRIYVPSREGATVVFRRDDKFEVLAVNRLDEPIDASPAIVGKQLFLRGEQHLYCIEEK